MLGVLITFAAVFFIAKAVLTRAGKHFINIANDPKANDPFAQILREMLNNLNGQSQQTGARQSRNDDSGSQSYYQPRPPQAPGAMTKGEAYSILGVQPNASKEEIRSAYLTLMKKIHPDSGGNEYLAKKVNEAKALLIGK